MSASSYSKMDDHGRPVKSLSREEQKTARISKKIEGVKSTMSSNIVKATARGAQLKDLEDQTEQLEASGKDFLKTSGDVKKMFQWKAFLWQLAFAAIILLVLSAVTLYILSATGVLNNQGRSSAPSSPILPLVATSPPTDAPAISIETSTDTATDSSTAALFALNPGIKAFKQPENLAKSWFVAGEKCSVGISTVTAKCAEGLVCMAQLGGSEGICRPAETPVAPDKFVPPSEDTSGGCPKGEIACTEELVAKGTECVIGRCIIGALPRSTSPEAPSPSTVLPPSNAVTAKTGSDPLPSAPLTAGSRVFEPNGEDATKTEAELMAALVLLHRHGADCAVGILHKDCTLDLMMQSWGVPL